MKMAASPWAAAYRMKLLEVPWYLPKCVYLAAGGATQMSAVCAYARSSTHPAEHIECISLNHSFQCDCGCHT